jgi:hypothetical protein
LRLKYCSASLEHSRGADYRKEAFQTKASNKLITALFWACASVIVLVQLAFSSAVYRLFVLPKFAAILVGAALILF